METERSKQKKIHVTWEIMVICQITVRILLPVQNAQDTMKLNSAKYLLYLNRSVPTANEMTLKIINILLIRHLVHAM